jgi:hypothetical protein
MSYCVTCGQNHHEGEEQIQAALDRELEIAKVNAKRDVDVARYQYRADLEGLETAEKIAKTEADAEVIAAVSEAEILGDAIEAGIVSDDEQEPLIAPIQVNEEPEPETIEEPEPETHHESKKKIGLGVW